MRLRSTFLYLFILISLVLFSCSQPKPQHLTIAAAANVQYALDSLVQVFESEYGVECDVVISSSGKLTAQISKGAPYDVFLSADMKYPRALYQDKYVKDEPIIYAQGSLVLWQYVESSQADLWQLLESSETKNIAIANPKTAPYGTAAIEALTATGLLDKVNDKLIYGESIAQTNHFITSGAAGVGFTAKSVVMTPEMLQKGRWLEVDPQYYRPIDQGMVIVNHDGYEVPAAKKFYDFMLSAKAQTILKDFGYRVSE